VNEASDFVSASLSTAGPLGRYSISGQHHYLSYDWEAASGEPSILKTRAVYNLFTTANAVAILPGKRQVGYPSRDHANCPPAGLTAAGASSLGSSSMPWSQSVTSKSFKVRGAGGGSKMDRRRLNRRRLRTDGATAETAKSAAADVRESLNRH